MLPDYLERGLRLVFVGTAVGERSADRGHYYAGPGNSFWTFLYGAGLTPTKLDPSDDATLPRYGIGLTDLVKSIAQSHDRGLPYDFPAFTRKIQDYQPGIVAFTSKEAGKAYARFVGQTGPQSGTSGLDGSRQTGVRIAITIWCQPNSYRSAASGVVAPTR